MLENNSTLIRKYIDRKIEGSLAMGMGFAGQTTKYVEEVKDKDLIRLEITTYVDGQETKVNAYVDSKTKSYRAPGIASLFFETTSLQ